MQYKVNNKIIPVQNTNVPISYLPCLIFANIFQLYQSLDIQNHHNFAVHLKLKLTIDKFHHFHFDLHNTKVFYQSKKHKHL